MRNKMTALHLKRLYDMACFMNMDTSMKISKAIPLLEYIEGISDQVFLGNLDVVDAHKDICIRFGDLSPKLSLFRLWCLHLDQEYNMYLLDRMMSDLTNLN